MAGDISKPQRIIDDSRGLQETVENGRGWWGTAEDGGRWHK